MDPSAFAGLKDKDGNEDGSVGVYLKVDGEGYMYYPTFCPTSEGLRLYPTYWAISEDREVIGRDGETKDALEFEAGLRSALRRFGMLKVLYPLVGLNASDCMTVRLVYS